MKKKYIIDAYNLMHQMADLRSRMPGDLEGAREALIIRISGYAQRCHVKISLVFDGQALQSRRRPAGPLVTVIYSRPPENADTMIKQLAEKKRPGQLCFVVTSDREIQRYVKMAGCQIISSQDFVKELTQPVSRPAVSESGPVLTEREIDEWMRLFKKEDRK